VDVEGVVGELDDVDEAGLDDVDEGELDGDVVGEDELGLGVDPG